VTPAYPQDVTPGKPPAQATVDAVEEMRARLAERTDLEESAKAAILERLKEAFDGLATAEEWTGKAAKFETERRDAPTSLERIRRELAEPPGQPTQAPPDASLTQLEQLQALAEGELKAAKEEAAALDVERRRRTDRRTEILSATAPAKKRLEQIESDLAATQPPGAVPDLSAASQMSLLARKQALNAQLEAFDRETASYDARGELLTARRDLAGRRVSEAEAALQAWQAIVTDRRRAETEAAAVAAEKTRREAARKHPVAGTLAEENARWAARRSDDRIADRIEQTNRDSEEVARLLDRLAAEYDSVTAKVRAAGLTNAMGLLLRRHRDACPDARRHQRAISLRQTEISDVQVKLIELDDTRRELADLEPLVKASISNVEDVADDQQRRDIEGAIRELLEARRSLVDGLSSDYDSYFRKLVDLDNDERRLVTRVDDFLEYIDEHVLWMRSTSPPATTDIVKLADALKWLTSPTNWRSTSSTVVTGAARYPLSLAAALAAFAALLAFRRRFIRRVELLGASAVRGTCTQLTPTAVATVLTILIAAPWPMLTWYIGRRLAISLQDGDFSRSVGAGFQAAGFAFLVLELLRQLCRTSGMAQAHFGWSGNGPTRLRRHLLSLIVLCVPLLFLVTVFEAVGNEEWESSLGRLAFVGGQLVLAFIAYRVFHPRHGVFRELLSHNPGGWLARLQTTWLAAAVLPPLLLAGLSIAGYFYTAIRLSSRLGFSVYLVVLVLVIYAFVQRWLLLSRRRVAIGRARERQRETEPAKDTDAPTGLSSPLVDEHLELSTIDAQSRRLLRAAATIIVFVGLWLVWIDVVPALGILQRVPLWTTTVTVSETTTAPDGTMTVQPREILKAISLADVGAMLIVLLVTYIATKNLPGLLEIMFLLRLPLNPGERYAITTVIRYVVTIVGLVLAFQAIGVSWSSIQWLAAAITVGLGFGLQEIFANFVSGLILLFERPIRLGDTVTVGDVEGTVSRIQIRATTVTDWNRKEIVIPNKEFVTGRIINWSLSDQIIRVVVRVGVAYGSDTRRAKEILLRVAADDHMVLDKPRPKAFFLEFGDSSLNLELRAFVKDIDDFLVARDRLHDAIDDAFKNAGIEIAFPQRDIHVRSIHQPLALSDEAVKAEERGIHPGSSRLESPTEGLPDGRQASQGDNK
jgi:potassium efflux system protein